MAPPPYIPPPTPYGQPGYSMYPGQTRPRPTSVADDPNASIGDKSWDLVTWAVKWPVDIGFKVANSAGKVIDGVTTGVIDAGTELTTALIDRAVTGGIGSGNIIWGAQAARGYNPYDYEAKYQAQQLFG